MQAELNKARRKLQESEEKYKALVEQSLQGLVIAQGLPPRLVFANPAMANILGYTIEELLSLPSGETSSLVHPEDREKFFERYQSRLADQEVKPHYQFRAIRKDGSVRWVEMFARRIHYKGKPSVQAAFVDITDREMAESAVRQSEERYRILFDESRDGIYFTTREGKFLDANKTALELFGYTEKEMKEKVNVLETYVNPADRDRFQKEIEKNGSVRDYEVLLHKKDGTPMYCLLTATASRSGDGTILGYQGIIRDVTKHKQAEDALRASEARYRAIVEDQTELICRFLPNGAITFVNEAYCRYFQKKPDELIGQSIMESVPEEDRVLVRNHFDSLTPENSVNTFEHRARTPDGEIRWLQWTTRMTVGKEEGPAEFQSVGRDITERTMMEDALRKSSEKIKLFAYSVSHDLKSPVIGVFGLTRLLRKRSWDVLDEKARKYCDQILKAAKQLATFVEKINVYMSTKETPLNIEDIKLEELLEVVKDEVSAELEGRQISWSQPEDLPQIRADRFSMLRLLRNLVDNSLKYGGEHLSHVRFGYEASGEFHILCLSDNGVGIKGADQERIFGLFERRETSKGIEGAGLGLAIVREIAEHHGGRVWMDTGTEKWTTFCAAISKNL